MAYSFEKTMVKIGALFGANFLSDSLTINIIYGEAFQIILRPLPFEDIYNIIVIHFNT